VKTNSCNENCGVDGEKIRAVRLLLCFGVFLWVFGVFVFGVFVFVCFLG